MPSGLFLARLNPLPALSSSILEYLIKAFDAGRKIAD
jgi:hypothetical protein